MRNGPGLPLAALAASGGLVLVAVVERVMRADLTATLSELEIGLATWAFVLALFGAQGLLSILLEGVELRPGLRPPRLTRQLTWTIVVSASVLLLLAVLLAAAILTGQPVAIVGTSAGVGCLVLALMLVAYKEAFVGDEARLDVRKDGIPW